MVKVWTNGCFDVLHRGHIEMLKYAKSLGNELLVGVDSDEKVKRDKGESRPFNNLEDRMAVLKSIRHVDRVVAFNSREELTRMIKEYSPDFLVVGSDWKNGEVVGKEYCKNIEFFDRIADMSTTRILSYLK
jgi:D-beta-D-heptose 7-phosphate kinase/D-beta-D-heptose 1-phosphate adenosyltransferase